MKSFLANGAQSIELKGIETMVKTLGTGTPKTKKEISGCFSVSHDQYDNYVLLDENFCIVTGNRIITKCNVSFKTSNDYYSVYTFTAENIAPYIL